MKRWIRRSLVWLSCVGWLTWTGCVSLGEPATPGQKGKLLFTYSGALFASGTPGCLFGCSLERPMVPGAIETITTRELEEDLPIVKGESLNPNVFKVLSVKRNISCCVVSGSGTACSTSNSCGGTIKQSYSFAVQAVGVGQAELVLRTQEGTLFESVALRVEKPARLSVELKEAKEGAQEPYQAVQTVILQKDRAYNVIVKTFTAKGLPMQLGQAVTMTLPNDNLASFATGLFFKGNSIRAEVSSAQLSAKTKGTTTLTVRVDGLTQTLPLTVQ